MSGFWAMQSGWVETDRLYRTEVFDCGRLRLPSGKLGVCDPFVNLDDPLVVELPPGDYPVLSTIADVSEQHDGSHFREAYLSLLLSDAPIDRVAGFVPPGAPDDPDRFYGIGVDAGTIAFADTEAIARYMPAPDLWYEQVFDNDDPGSWFNRIDNPIHLRAGLANVELPYAPAGENVVLSHSGWGDGFYPLLISYDAYGTMTGVHLDLLVLSDTPPPE